MTELPDEQWKVDVAYSYKCELCSMREWHIKPSTKFHYFQTKKCFGLWIEEKWFNTSFLEAKRKELKEKICDRTHEIFTGKCSTLSPDSGWTCQNCIDVNAVFEGEEEHYQEDEYQPTEQEIHDLGGEGK